MLHYVNKIQHPTKSCKIHSKLLWFFFIVFITQYYHALHTLILLFLKILAWNKACLVMIVSILSTLKDIIIVCVNMSKFIPQQETKLQTRRLAFCIFNNSLLCLTKRRNTDSDPVYSPLLGQMWQRFKLGTRPGMTRVGHVCCLRGGGVTPKRRPCRLQTVQTTQTVQTEYFFSNTRLTFFGSTVTK